MKNLYSKLLATLVFVILTSSSFSQSDIYESYVILDINAAGNAFYDLNVNTANLNFDGANLGTFTSTNSLILNGAQNKTYKCGTHNIMNGFIDYRVYLVGDAPPAFTPSEILFNVDDGSSNFCGNTSVDQTWESSGANIDILNGLPSGDYVLEVYTRADVDWDGDNILNNILYISNSGANYLANFRKDNPPTAACQNITVQLDASGNASITGNDIDNGSTDDFGITSITASITNFSCADLGTNNVTLTVTDSIGQTDTCVAIVTVEEGLQSATASLSSSAGNATCLSDNVTFTASGTNLGLNPQYEWFLNSVSIGNNNSEYNTDTLNDGDEIYVEITSTSCNTVTVTSNTIIMGVFQPATAEAGPDQIMCFDTPLQLNGVFGGSATSGSWTSVSGGFVNDIYYPSMSQGVVTLYFVTDDPPGPCGPAIDSMEITIVFPNTANAGNLSTITDCDDTTIQLFGNMTGEWSAESVPAGSPYSFSDINDPTASFTGINGVTYDITWTVQNDYPCVNEDTFTVSFPVCGDSIDFDGTNDYVNFNDNNNLSAAFSIEAWLKSNANNSNTKTILSKRDANDLSTGYDLSLVNNTISFNANNYSISASGIDASRWYHVAVTYDGTDYTLYVDGIQRANSPGPGPTTNAYDMLLGAMSVQNSTAINHFNGWLDEIKLWNTALTVEQIRLMMNQEIEDNTSVRGTVLGLDIPGLNWSDLAAYYQMNQGTSDISGGNLVGDKGVSGQLFNMVTLQDESAPLPYTTANNGNWDNSFTWQNGNVQMIPNTNNVDWNIVRINHNVASGNRPTTLAGLLIDSNRYAITNAQSLQVNNYLKIDGLLDLVNESQFLQTDGSIVDYSGTGNLERDQQGTTNLYNYNYWASPVGNNNTSYSLNNVLYDGSDTSNLQLVQWTTNPNAIGSTVPITMSSRWLYLYENYPENTYADWNAITETNAIPVGLGFTMKGSGNTGTLQNYTFIGQPNNGDISSPVTGGNQALVGNPYPSALDAHTFINDNSSVLLDGTLYFWEHSPTNNTHELAQYQGGYAYLNLTTGVPAVSPPEINGTGTATKIPRQYIPVGQGFFVTGNATGGNINFNNNQRAFVRESSGNSIFLRNMNTISNSTINTSTSTNKYIRLDFVNPENLVRHLALGFMPNSNATDGIDFGFDALNQHSLPDDMTFSIEGKQFIIQGVGDFDNSKNYPLDIELTNDGSIKIILTDLENFENPIDVFIYDSLLNTYTQLNEVDFQISLEAGQYSRRFFLVFSDESTLSNIQYEEDVILVNYLQTNNEILIKVNNRSEINQIHLFNLTGQLISSWDTKDINSTNNIRIPVDTISEGHYILKVVTNNSTLNKKVIIKY